MSTSASSKSQWGGAQSTPAKTSASKNEWQGAIAFANIGLAGAAVRGNQWRKHRKKLLKQFTELLQYRQLKVVGLCLNEVGNLSDLLTPEDRQHFDELIQEAFQQAGATEHGPAQIIWSEGETVSAWRQEQVVKSLLPLTNIPKVHAYRTLDRLEVMGDTEHGPCSLLIYNNHQPASDERPFPKGMRRTLCRATLEDAIKHANASNHNIGFTYGGDGNCSLGVWKPVLDSFPEYRLTFEEAQLLWGKGRKPGDLMVAAGIPGFETHDEERCDVENRDPAHACLMLSWCYKAHATGAKSPLPARASTFLNPNTGKLLSERCQLAAQRPKTIHSTKSTAYRQHTAEVNGRWRHAPAEQTVPDGCQMATDGYEMETDGQMETDVRMETAMGTDGQMGATGGCYRWVPGSTTDGCYTAPAARHMPQVTAEIEDAPLKRAKTEDPQNDSSTEPSAWRFLEPGAASEAASEAAPEADYTNMNDDAAEDHSSPEEETPTDERHERHTDHIGFALANSALRIHRRYNAEICYYSQLQICIDAGMDTAFEDLCTKEDRKIIETAAEDFFCKKKDTGVPEHGRKAGVKPQQKSASVLKSKSEVTEAWQQIFERRRLQERDDTAAISNPRVLARMYTDWMNEWIPNHLTQAQLQRPRSSQTSIFNAYIKGAVGGKQFLMAVWQTGITWAPPSELLATNYGAAVDYVVTNFTIWARRVANSIRSHKQATKTVEATKRSGQAWVGIAWGSARGLP